MKEAPKDDMSFLGASIWLRKISSYKLRLFGIAGLFVELALDIATSMKYESHRRAVVATDRDFSIAFKKAYWRNR